MKNKIYIISLLFISILFGCKDEYEAPMFLSDASWLISESNNVRINEGIYVVDEGHWISFADLSQGTTSHTWTISDSTQFMRTGFGKEEEDYSKFVIPNSGNVSEEAKVHVYFGEAGLRNVRLFNTFRDSVSFTSTGEAGISGDTLASYYDNSIDAWVIDTTFYVDVYGGLKPALEVYKILEDAEGNVTGEELVAKVLEGEIFELEDSASFETVALEMGQKLRFVDLTTFDRPDSISWSINHKTGDNTFSSANDTTIGFNQIGGGRVGSLKVFRHETDDLKAISAATYIPLAVTVGPSSKPFKIDGAIYETTVSADNAVTFAVTGAIGNIRPSAQNAFKVLVNNIDAGISNKSISVKTVSVHPDNEGVLVLAMEEGIYNSDEITIEYAPSDDSEVITRQDTRPLDAFSSQTVIPYFEELVTNREFAGVEVYHNSTNANGCKADGWWMNGSNGTFPDNMIFERVDATEFSQVLGEASMRVQGEYPSGNCRVDLNYLSEKDIAAGNYVVSMMVYIVSGSGMDQIKVQNNKGSGSFIHIFDVSESAVERDKWVKVSDIIAVDEILATEPIKFRVDPKVGAYTGQQHWYFDEISFEKIESRP